MDNGYIHGFRNALMGGYMDGFVVIIEGWMNMSRCINHNLSYHNLHEYGYLS